MNKYLEKIAAQYGVRLPYYMEGTHVMLNDEEHNKYLDEIKKNDTIKNYLKTTGLSILGYGGLGAGIGALAANKGKRAAGAMLAGSIGALIGSHAGPIHHKQNLRDSGLEKAVGKKKIDKLLTSDKIL